MNVTHFEQGNLMVNKWVFEKFFFGGGDLTGVKTRVLFEEVFSIWGHLNHDNMEPTLREK